MIAETDYAGRQMLGARDGQEDVFAFSAIQGDDDCADGLLVVVADGMGGHRSGEVASAVALAAFLESFQGSHGAIPARLQHGLAGANKALAMEFERAPKLKGMGATLLAAAITAAGLYWISVGDSLLYLLRNGSLIHLNEDHSYRPFLNELIEAGKLTPEKAATHPFRNLLQSVVQGIPIELIDAPDHPLALENGDLLLAATDGLLSLTEPEIARVLSVAPAIGAEGAAGELLKAVQAANKPKQDNTTITVVLPSPPAGKLEPK